MCRKFFLDLILTALLFCSSFYVGAQEPLTKDAPRESTHALGFDFNVVDRLPVDARELLEKLQLKTNMTRRQAQQHIDGIRTKAEQEIESVNNKIKETVKHDTEETVSALLQLQKTYMKKEKLDETLLIQDQIQQLKGFEQSASISCQNPQPAPAILATLHPQIGATFCLEITGRVGAGMGGIMEGPVWGTGVYTTDSSLATAAVHAGVVPPGQKKVVKVTIISSPPNFQGSTRNGVTSGSWGVFPSAFRFE